MKYELHQGDCIRVMHRMKEEGKQFDISVFSPPFADLFVYNQDIADMGNSPDDYDDTYNLHFEFFAKALFPLIKSGRLVFLHLQQVVRRKSLHGHMGLFDIRGHVNRIMQNTGFVLYGEIAVPKNPQAQSIRLKAHQLQFSQWEKDSTVSRPALADWVQVFKKPEANEVPVCPLENGLNRNTWIDWADMVWKPNDAQLSYPSSIWFDINETRVLNNSATCREIMGGAGKRSKTKFNGDTKHLCPLQLDLIERCVLGWSNKGETLFTPFAGVGSELVGALLHNRNAVGIDLNRNYLEQARKNCDGVIFKKKTDARILTLFDIDKTLAA